MTQLPPPFSEEPPSTTAAAKAAIEPTISPADSRANSLADSLADSPTTAMAPGDTAPLVQFLRQHHPPIPAAAVDFEARLMAALESPALAHQAAVNQPRSPVISRLRHRWALPTAVAASLIASLVGYCTLQSLTQDDPSSVEAFVENIWQAPLSDNGETPEAVFVSELFSP